MSSEESKSDTGAGAGAGAGADAVAESRELPSSDVVIRTLLNAKSNAVLTQAARDSASYSEEVQAAVKEVLENWSTDRQAIYNVLQNPALIPESVRTATLMRGLNEEVILPYVVAAARGCFVAETEMFSEEDKPEFIKKLLTTVFTSPMEVTACNAACAFVKHFASDSYLDEIAHMSMFHDSMPVRVNALKFLCRHLCPKSAIVFSAALTGANASKWGGPTKDLIPFQLASYTNKYNQYCEVVKSGEDPADEFFGYPTPTLDQLLLAGRNPEIPFQVIMSACEQFDELDTDNDGVVRLEDMADMAKEKGLPPAALKMQFTMIAGSEDADGFTVEQLVKTMWAAQSGAHGHGGGGHSHGGVPCSGHGHGGGGHGHGGHGHGGHGHGGGHSHGGGHGHGPVATPPSAPSGVSMDVPAGAGAGGMPSAGIPAAPGAASVPRSDTMM